MHYKLDANIYKSNPLSQQGYQLKYERRFYHYTDYLKEFTPDSGIETAADDMLKKLKAFIVKLLGKVQGRVVTAELTKAATKVRRGADSGDFKKLLNDLPNRQGQQIKTYCMRLLFEVELNCIIGHPRISVMGLYDGLCNDRDARSPEEAVAISRNISDCYSLIEKFKLYFDILDIDLEGMFGSLLPLPLAADINKDTIVNVLIISDSWEEAASDFSLALDSIILENMPVLQRVLCAYDNISPFRYVSINRTAEDAEVYVPLVVELLKYTKIEVFGELMSIYDAMLRMRKICNDRSRAFPERAGVMRQYMRSTLIQYFGAYFDFIGIDLSRVVDKVKVIKKSKAV